MAFLHKEDDHSHSEEKKEHSAEDKYRRNLKRYIPLVSS